jgi:hypothetical protein
MKGSADPSQLIPQRKVSHAAVVLVSLSLSMIGLGQTPLATTAAPPRYSPGPIIDYRAALPNCGDVLRFRRSERYNIPGPSVQELGENSETAIWDLPETHFQKNPMPFDASDAVVVGTVNAGQAYLSNDRRNIYSDILNSNSSYRKLSRLPTPLICGWLIQSTFNAKEGRSGFRAAK